MNNALGGRFEPIGRFDEQFRTELPSVAHLSPDLQSIDFTGERLTENLGQARDRRQHLHGVAMDKHEASVWIDLAQGLESENMIRALQDPLPATLLMLKVLEEAFVKPIGLEMS